MSSLGKRKERADAEPTETHGATLFVSNLPYTATSTDLQTLFSDLAPVRSAFVVTEQGTGTSKGVGYVAFATREDAEGAMGEIGEKGLVLQGRALRASWAASKSKDRKSKADDTKPDPDATAQPKPKPKPQRTASASTSTARDPDAIRTVVVSGLPPGIDAKALWKKFRKQTGAESVAWPAPAPGGSEDPASAHVLFDTPAHAFDGVQKLHAHVFKGALLSATLKKRLDGVAAPSASKAQAKAKGPAPNRASRLIVRNLPFDVTEQDLRALFLPYGTIYSVHIPQAKATAKEDGGASEVKDEGEGEEEEVKEEEEGEDHGKIPAVRGRGFAFVWMWTKREAEKAMEGVNGKTVHAGMAEEMVRDKQMRKKARREAKKGKGAAVEGEGAEDDEGGGARVVAVDWALSKDKWEAEKQKMGEEGGEESEDDDEDEDSGDEEGSHVGLHDDSDVQDSDEDGDEDDDRSDADERTKPHLPPPEAGTTLFVRNIPFEATDDELRTLFRAFGPLRYARITMDHATGRSRGTGFACFWNKEDADKAVEQSAILRAETTGAQSDTPKKNPFSMPSILTPDPSALSAMALVLHGRTLDVVRAVTREEATRLKEEGEKAREKADKRNMYLLREGVILPNTPAASTLPPAELEKRTNSFNARRTLLKSNPSLYVSKTRLSIRQLPLFVTETLLRRMARHALRAFDDDVKAGRRTRLSAEELAADEEKEKAEVGNEGEEAKKKAKSKEEKKGRVKQAKVVRQAERVDARTGLGRSKGYGFLEMRRHADALRVLRWANNNPELTQLWSVWEKEEREVKESGKGKEKEKEGRKDGKEGKKAVATEGFDESEGDRKIKGALIVEFSIENVQVVQRRATKEKEARSKGKEQPKPREKLALPKREASADTTAGPGAPKKRRKLDGGKVKVENGSGAGTTDSKAAVHDAAEKKSSSLGSLIGRKRKERKGKAGK